MRGRIGQRKRGIRVAYGRPLEIATGEDSEVTTALEAACAASETSNGPTDPVLPARDLKERERNFSALQRARSSTTPIATTATAHAVASAPPISNENSTKLDRTANPFTTCLLLDIPPSLFTVFAPSIGRQRHWNSPTGTGVRPTDDIVPNKSDNLLTIAAESH